MSFNTRITLFLSLFFSFFYLVAQSQEVSNIYHLGTSGQDSYKAIATDSNNNVYILAQSFGSLTINNIQYPHPYGSGYYTYLIKLTSSKDLVWYKTFKYYNTSYDNSNIESRMLVDGDGNIFITDDYWNNMIINNQTYYPASGITGYATYKLNSSGDIIWSKNEGSTIMSLRNEKLEMIGYVPQNGTINGQSITNVSATVVWLDTAGNYVSHIQYDDPTYGTEVLKGRDKDNHFYGYRKIYSTSDAAYDELELFKIDSLGQLLNSKIVAYNWGVGIRNLISDPEDGSFYFLNRLFARSPLNSSIGTNYTQTMIVKTDHNFNFLRSVKLGPVTNVNGGYNPSINLVKNNLYIAGQMYIVFGDTSWSSLGQDQYIYPENYKLIFSKFSKDLNFKWYREIPQRYYASQVYPPFLLKDSLTFYGIHKDFTMDANGMDANGMDDLFFLQVIDHDTSKVQLNGEVFFDKNQNGIKDTLDLPVPNSMLTNNLSAQDIYFTNSNGHYSIESGVGNQTIRSISLNDHWIRSTPDSINITVNQNDTTISELNFGMYPIPNITELSIDIIPLTEAKPGFDATYRIEVCNNGTDTISGYTLIEQDAFLHFSSSSITVDSLVDEKLYFSFSSLNPNECFQFTVTDSVSNQFLLGYHLSLIASVFPSGTGNTDTLPINNYKQIYHLVTGSFDPNNITVIPSCGITNSFIQNGELLEYIIKFQNTGTSEAIDILVTDSISSQLELSSFEFISSSHNVNISIVNRVLRLQFDSIMLEPEAIGYFKYKIRPVSSFNASQTIENKVNIFFDFNAPIVTNIVNTSLITPSNSVETILFPANCSAIPNGKIHFSAPCLEGKIYVSLDNEPFIENINGSFENLTAGEHFIRLTNTIDTLESNQLTIDLIIPVNNQSVSICQNDSINLNGVYVSTPGTYIDTLQNVMGCDSIVHTFVQLKMNSFYSQTIHICSGDSILINGIYQHASNIYYQDTIPNHVGCDSIRSTQLVVDNPSYNTIYVEACTEFHSPSGNYIWFSSGTYLDTIYNQMNCDSIITIHLTIDHINSSIILDSGILTVVQLNNNSIYEWIDCNTGTIINNQSSSFYEPMQNGTYAVIITENNCVDTSECIIINNLGLQYINLQKIGKVHPNPSTGIVYIDIQDMDYNSYEIRTVAGSCIKSEEIFDPHIEIELSDVEDGIYYIILKGNLRNDLPIKMIKKS